MGLMADHMLILMSALPDVSRYNNYSLFFAQAMA